LTGILFKAEDLVLCNIIYQLNYYQYLLGSKVRVTQHGRIFQRLSCVTQTSIVHIVQTLGVTYKFMYCPMARSFTLTTCLPALPLRSEDRSLVSLRGLPQGLTMGTITALRGGGCQSMRGDMTMTAVLEHADRPSHTPVLAHERSPPPCDHIAL
jgi:hypothetical protein